MVENAALNTLSEYERRAWETSLERLNEPPAKKFIPHRVRESVVDTAERANDFADAHLPIAQVKDIAEKAMSGAFELMFVPALQSASTEGALKGYRKRFDVIEVLDDIKKLDLKEVDRFRRTKSLYVAGSVAQGAATSLTITGGTVSTTVSGGATAGVVVGALVVDTVAMLALMGRTVGSVAVRYGYDVKLPEEELYAMAVMTLGTASNASARVAALTSLSRLTQEMMRNATWSQLNRHALVRVLKQVFNSLGLKMTQRKLGQLVPIAGVAISAALNANLTHTLYRRAEDVYRVRFLTEKYGLDAETWIDEAMPNSDGEEGYEDVIDIAELIEDEVAKNSADGDTGQLSDSEGSDS